MQKETTEAIRYTAEEKQLLSACCLCPRQCGVNRFEGVGFCNLDSRIAIASICNHKGEEPIINGIKGICNVFFSHCNLQCVYCQNYQISRRYSSANLLSPEGAVRQIIDVLSESENVVGFVSPTSQVPQMLLIIRLLQEKGIKPVIVYNTNSYDEVEVLKQLEGIVDVYLADMRYALVDLAQHFSEAANYPEKAIKAIGEMYRQKGSSILTGSEDRIESGLMIRVLCLPEMSENTMQILDLIAENISINVQISLLSQYHPPSDMQNQSLNRLLSQKEYELIIDYALKIGFRKILTQELSSAKSLIPDFERESPFNN